MPTQADTSPGSSRAARDLKPAHQSIAIRRRALWIILLIVFAASLGSVLFYRTSAGPGYPLDDSYIHFAFARHLAGGHGFGINPDQPVPGATSPLWVLLLSVGFLFNAGTAVWPWVLGVIVLASCGHLAARLCLNLSGRDEPTRSDLILAGGAGVAVSSCFPLVWSAAGGMEPPLFSACLLLALLALHRARGRSWSAGAVWGICLGLVIAARPEGLILVPIFIIAEILLGHTWRVGRSIVGTLSAVAWSLPYAVFCFATTGRFFANTYYAKTHTTDAHWPTWEAVAELFSFAWIICPEAILAIPVILVAGISSLRTRTPVGAAMFAGLAFALALPVGYATMERTDLFAGGAGNFGRYLFPMAPPLMALGFAGLARWLDRVRNRLGDRTVFFAAMIVSVGAAGSVFYHSLHNGRPIYAANVRDINGMQVRMAEILETRLRSKSLVAANDVGALACLTDLRVIDLVGIVSTDVLDVLRPREGPPPGDQEAALLELLVRRKPDALVVFPDWYPAIFSQLRSGLDVIEEIHVPDNITSGGNRLVAYQIDWTRIDLANLEMK